MVESVLKTLLDVVCHSMVSFVENFDTDIMLGVAPNSGSSLVTTKYDPWVLVGEFNSFLSSDEKREGRPTVSSCKLFQNFIQGNGLRDLGFKGSKFTWRRGVVFERLDRAIRTCEWFCSFPDTILFHLPQQNWTIEPF